MDDVWVLVAMLMAAAPVAVLVLLAAGARQLASLRRELQEVERRLRAVEEQATGAEVTVPPTTPAAALPELTRAAAPALDQPLPVPPPPPPPVTPVVPPPQTPCHRRTSLCLRPRSPCPRR